MYFDTALFGLFESNINSYKRAISESYVIEDDVVFDVNYISPVEFVDSIDKAIKSFYMSSDKTPDNLSELISNTLSRTSKQDIIVNIDRLFNLPRDTANRIKRKEAYTDISCMYNIPDTKNKLKEWDFWGPLIFCFLLGISSIVLHLAKLYHLYKD